MKKDTGKRAENKIKRDLLWLIYIFAFLLFVVIARPTGNANEHYENGYEAGKKAGINVAYSIGITDGSEAGNKNGIIDGELLLQFGKVTPDFEPRKIPEAKISAPSFKEIFKAVGRDALLFGYVKGYQRGYSSEVEESYCLGYKSGYKESYKQTYWIYEERHEEKLADELATVYTVPAGSSDENKNPASESEGNREAPPQYYAPVAEKCDYVLNKNTMKFHYPSCSSASQIKESNREYFTGNRDDVIARGFSPCGRCHP